MVGIPGQKATKLPGPPERQTASWLSRLDGRLAIAQEMRRRYQALVDDLGGEGQLSYMQRSLIERALWLEYWLAEQERALAEGRDFDVGKWVQAVNSLQGLYSRLGIGSATSSSPASLAVGSRMIPHLFDE